MKIVFVSNYLNHHQLPLSSAFIEAGAEYWFIASSVFNEKRLILGYRDMNSAYSWVVRAYESEAERMRAERLIFDADVVIYGSAPDLVKRRIKAHKLTFRYSERPFKRKRSFTEMLLRRVVYACRFGKYKNHYLLCASAYAASDYAKIGAFVNKTYKWGYFPEVKSYGSVKEIITKTKICNR